MSDIIVALDVDSIDEAGALVARLKHRAAGFKVGLQLFTRYGPDAVRLVARGGGRVFLDLKLYDIPQTVSKAVDAASALGVWMMTVHAGGGEEMMRTASQAAAKGKVQPIVLGVTRLTSDPESSGMKDEVLKLAAAAGASGLNGVVCSGDEAEAVRRKMGSEFLIVTPGIRRAEDSREDQRRVATAESARRSGANFLVIGRPVVQAPDPLKALESFI